MDEVMDRLRGPFVVRWLASFDQTHCSFLASAWLPDRSSLASAQGLNAEVLRVDASCAVCGDGPSTSAVFHVKRPPNRVCPTGWVEFT